MHSYILSIILNHSILIPAILGIARLKFITSKFYPILLLILLGSINESLSLMFIYKNGTNAINSNVYVLLEYFFILMQFYAWNDYTKNRYILCGAIGFSIWLTDNFVINSINENNSLFRVLYALTIVFFSINQINKLIIYERSKLMKNGTFIFYAGFIFYFGCKAFVEAFNMFHFGLSDFFLWNLWIILYFVNVIANIVYALAILCIPTKQQFFMQF